MKQLSLLSAFILSALVSPFAHAAGSANSKPDYECISRSPGEDVCLVTPPDAPARVPLNFKPVREGVSLLQRSDLEGRALNLENVFILVSSFDPVDSNELFVTRPDRVALDEVQRTRMNLNGIETYLKAGPSSRSPDIRVSKAPKSGPVKN